MTSDNHLLFPKATSHWNMCFPVFCWQSMHHHHQLLVDCRGVPLNENILPQQSRWVLRRPTGPSLPFSILNVCALGQHRFYGFSYLRVSLAAGRRHRNTTFLQSTSTVVRKYFEGSLTLFDRTSTVARQ